MYLWTYITVSLILLVPVFITFWILNRSQPQPLLAFLLALPFFYRGYMERKYIKETKRHKASFISAFILLFISIIFLVLMLLL
ncbi:DUF4181 domain-containing protein [Paenibacillus sp. JCM 10914]|uniref:DUF4181 domain-containing protein n=1 Tax=Paenibacillus sp. JCM 10914 TaxID=1236974 RepID=UPI0009E0AE5F